MKLLEERILRDGEVKSGEILKVDRFLNHQMDPTLFYAMAEEWKRLYDGCGVNKLLTIEASGIGIACVAGLVFGVPVVFAKKSKSRNVSDDVYTAQVPSFTHGGVNTVQIDCSVQLELFDHSTAHFEFSGQNGPYFAVFVLFFDQILDFHNYIVTNVDTRIFYF